MLLAILGRQPQISLAELVSQFDSVSLIAPDVARIDHDQVDLTRLGGVIKMARVVTTLPTSHLPAIVLELAKPEISNQLFAGKTGKLLIGLNIHGRKIPPKELFSLGLELKKHLKQSGLAIRLVPSENQVTTAAQVTHNRLIDKGADIIIVFSGNQAIIGVTEQIQDIEAYGQRDYGRPARSAKVGMLPPKLAQIMINLANPAPGSNILDPFCGTGVILQEALLMGYQALGSDLDPHMVAYTSQNMEWLKSGWNTPLPPIALADARTKRWNGEIGGVVTEGYLGPALSSPPDPTHLATLKSDASELVLAFLSNLHRQLSSGTPVVITLPAWKSISRQTGFERLDVLDRIKLIGYDLKQFLPVEQADLLYHRPDQIVGRELVALTRV